MATAPHISSAEIDQLWTEAQGPRDPRSEAYMLGIYYGLACHVVGLTTTRPTYEPGSTASDAWHAGVREGHERVERLRSRATEL